MIFFFILLTVLVTKRYAMKMVVAPLEITVYTRVTVQSLVFQSALLQLGKFESAL